MALLKDTRGSEVVEMAFMLPLLLAVLAGILDMGFLFNNYLTLTNAAREGARIAALPGTASTVVEDRVKGYLAADGMRTTAVTTTVTPVAIAVPGGTINGIQVVVSYPYTYMILGPLMQLIAPASSFNQVTLSAAATMRAEVAAGL